MMPGFAVKLTVGGEAGLAVGGDVGLTGAGEVGVTGGEVGLTGEPGATETVTDCVVDPPGPAQVRAKVVFDVS
jgi:hypothetical protein